MTFHSLFERLSAFLLNLECLDTEGQKEAFMNEVIETGGTYTPPTDDNWSSHLFEISLHGIAAYGASEGEAIRNWRKAARAALADKAVFDCPEWPHCGCPGGAARPDCPALPTPPASEAAQEARP